MADLIWEGPSTIDGDTPIRLWLVGRTARSTNRKTGSVLQTYILVRDTQPTEAIKTGEDFAICGNCAHRSSPRTCYVNVGQAPYAIFNSLNSVSMPLTPDLAAGKVVRLGAYGDPAAVPYDVWATLLSDAKDWLGYTHQWKTCDQRFKQYCMASVDSPGEYDQAHDLGWRCFYVGKSLEDRPPRAALCPASAEAGKKLQCADCLSCSGLGGAQRVGDVFIPAHGPSYIVQRFQNKAA